MWQTTCHNASFVEMAPMPNGAPWLQVASLELAAGAQPGGGAAAREFYEGKGRNKVMAKAKEAVSSWAIS